MHKPKIYLETTIFNFYFDDERDTHADTVKLFEEIANGRYETFTSDYVVKELERASIDKRDKMIGLISEYDLIVLDPSEEAVNLANIYVAAGVIPVNYRTDALHIAIAAVNDLDIIVSMNFQHIVKRKTMKMTSAINIINGYKAVEIYSPMEIIENE